MARNDEANAQHQETTNRLSWAAPLTDTSNDIHISLQIEPKVTYIRSRYYEMAAPGGKNKRTSATYHVYPVNITSTQELTPHGNTTLYAYFNGWTHIQPHALKTASVEGVYFFLKDVLLAKRVRPIEVRILCCVVFDKEFGTALLDARCLFWSAQMCVYFFLRGLPFRRGLVWFKYL